MAMPGAASASGDFGMGFVMTAVPTFVYALGPVILLEAVVLALALNLGPLRALMISLRANVRSTILVVLAILAFWLLVGLTKLPELTKVVASWMMVPLFGIAWWLEYSTVVRLEPERRRHRVYQATGWANLISFCAIFAATWAYSPSNGNYVLRTRVIDAATRAESTKEAVSRFWYQTGRLPGSAKELPESIPVYPHESITLEPSARVSVRLSYAEILELDGKHFVFTPIVPDNTEKQLEWKCGSPDIPDKYMPMPCRSGR